MKYCKKCVMPDTRPGIHFNEKGICAGCLAAEKRKKTDWKKRFKELESLCNKYRGKNGDYYDCVIAVSGGKDSHYQTYIMKEVMGMNPLLVSVGNLTWTEVGRRNIENISEAFGCDLTMLSPNRKVAKKMIRKALEKLGSPFWYIDRAIYVFPIRTAINMKIPLVVYGENTSYEYGGHLREETPSAKEQINNDAVKSVEWDFWLDKDIKMKDLNAVIYPTEKEIKEAKLDPIYLSYFTPWDSHQNYTVAKRYGFRDLTHEWIREHHMENFSQVDTLGYLVHSWLKYPKYGHATVTDLASRFIRSGIITRLEAIKMIKERECNLDQRTLDDFLAFTGYTHKEFWDIVEKYWNRDIFEKVNEEWKLKHPIWKQEKTNAKSFARV